MVQKNTQIQIPGAKFEIEMKLTPESKGLEQYEKKWHDTEAKTRQPDMRRRVNSPPGGNLQIPASWMNLRTFCSFDSPFSD